MTGEAETRASVPDYETNAHVFLRPIGSPLTLAMSGLAIGSLVQSGLDLRWVGLSQTLAVGLILAVPFVLQTIAAVLCYLARDGAAGAAVGVLGASWLGLGLIHITSPLALRSGALGLMLLAVAGVLALSALAVATAKPLPGVVFVITALRLAVAGVYQLGGSDTWQHAAGVLGLIVVGLAGYCVLAFELEGQQHRPVLPTLRVGRGRAAVLGSSVAAVDDVSHEPGVRQTT